VKLLRTLHAWLGWQLEASVVQTEQARKFNFQRVAGAEKAKEALSEAV
jgi:ATP-dependent Zn protease